jgi:hypothetical protein
MGSSPFLVNEKERLRLLDLGGHELRAAHVALRLEGVVTVPSGPVSMTYGCEWCVRQWVRDPRWKFRG